MKKSARVYILIVLFFAFINCEGQIITTIAGNGIAGYAGDGGPATAAQLSAPYGSAVDDSGNIYVADYGSAKVRKIDKAGIITTFAGTGTLGYTGDGGQATAANLRNVYGVAVDTAHNVYIVDGYYCVIRKVDTAGIITTIAGNGTSGYTGDGGNATAAQLKQPFAVAFDRTGNMYIADMFNSVVRKVNTAGIITTFAGTGTGGFTGGGYVAATTVPLSWPQGVAADLNGNVYIADGGNHLILKVDTAGIIYVVAGTGASSYLGDGGAAVDASMSTPEGLAVDGEGNFYFADVYNNAIRKVSTAGGISTCAGSGWSGYSGDGGPATVARLHTPTGIAIDAAGNMYIADNANNVMRKVSDISGLTHICIGDSVSFSAFAAGGIWTSSAPGIATVNAVSGLVTGISTGSAIIYHAIGTDTTATTVYIQPTPYAGTITGADSICVGTSTLLTYTMPGGTWTPSSFTTISEHEVSGFYPGTHLIQYEVKFTCGIATAVFPITFVKPNAGYIAGLDSVCVDDTIAFFYGAPGGDWTLKNTTLATLIDPGLVRAITAGKDTIVYTVTTAIPGCSDSSIRPFNIFSTAHCTQTAVINTPQKDNLPNIYPNPSTGILYIDLAAKNEERNISLSDIYGRVLHTKTLPANATKIELHLHLPSGTYILNIQDSKTAVVRKIMME